MKTVRNLIIVTLLLVANFTIAQGKYAEKITSKWPYLYNEFQNGTLYFDGGKVSNGSFNIDIANQTLVFFEEDKIVKSVNAAIKVDSLVLSETSFYKTDALYEVIAQKGSHALLKKVRIDPNAANDTGGGYGTGSSTDATTRITSVDVANYTGVAYEVAKLELGKGNAFETITSYYLSTTEDAAFERVSKKAFALVFPEADVKSIIKSGGFKLNKEDDLIQLFKQCAK